MVAQARVGPKAKLTTGECPCLFGHVNQCLEVQMDCCVALHAAPTDACVHRVSLTCHLDAWWCSRTPGSAEKTRWLQSAASRLPWGPDLGLLTPGCVGTQTQKGLNKQTIPAGVKHAAAATTPLTTVIPLPAALAGRYDLLTIRNTHMSVVVIHKKATLQSSSLSLFTAFKSQ